MNPDAWDFSSFLLEPNFAEPLAMRETPTTPLFPFRRLENKFWDSNACRRPESLGYKYQDYLTGDTDTPAQIQAKIDTFYGWLFPGRSLDIPDRVYTGYPRNLRLAECLAPNVFIDHVDPAPKQDYPKQPRAVLSARGLATEVSNPIDIVPPVLESSVSNVVASTASTDLKAASTGLVTVPPTSTDAAIEAVAASSTTQPTTMEPKAQTLGAVSNDAVTKDGRKAIRYRLPARPAVARNIRKPNLVTSNPAESHVVKNGKLRHWQALAQFEKFTLSGSFDILFFIGDFAPAAGKWFRDRNMVGTIFNWANNEMESCPNCRVQAGGGLLLGDGIQLTHSLLDLIKSGQMVNGLRLESLEPEDVVPFLTRNLHWRILDNFGQERQREEVGGLKVQVMERLVSLPLLEGDAHVFEEYTVHADITHGRPGGLNRGEEA